MKEKDAVFQKFKREAEAWLSGEGGADAFDALISAYGAERAASWLVRAFGTEKTYLIARKAEGARLFAPRTEKAETVAFFYHRYHNGGVERVLSLLIPRFMAWGYRTVLFVEEESEADYALPAACPKVLLPTSKKCGAEGYAKHAAALAAALRLHRVDALLYQAAASEYLLYDMIAAKGCGAGFYVSMHELLLLPVLLRRPYLAAEEAVLRLADGVQSLVRSDAAFLAAAGIRAHYITNPCWYAVSEKISPANGTVVWVGRFDDVQKRPRDAIRVMAELQKGGGDTRLVMVGTSGSKGTDRQYRKFAKRAGVADKVEFVGFCADPVKYYRQASVLLMTSAFEACSMVLLEGMSCGLPVVSYAMPYQEPLRQSGGGICVPQGDAAAAAKAIEGLFAEESKRAEAARASLQTAAAFAAADLRSGWERMLEGGVPCLRTDERDLQIGMDTLFDFYERAYGKEEGLLVQGLRYAHERGLRAAISRSVRYVRQNGIKNVVRRIFGK